MYPIVEVERSAEEVLAAANVEQEHLFAGPGYPVRGGVPEGSGAAGRRGDREMRIASEKESGDRRQLDYFDCIEESTYPLSRIMGW